VFIPRLKLVY